MGKVYPISQVAYEGSTVIINCFSRTLPIWTKDGKVLSEGVIITNTKLMLLHVKENNTGLYTCEGYLDNQDPFRSISEVLVGCKMYQW